MIHVAFRVGFGSDKFTVEVRTWWVFCWAWSVEELCGSKSFQVQVL